LFSDTSVAQLDEQCDRVIELISKIASCMAALILMGGFFIINDAMSLLYIVFMFILSTFINKGLSKFNFIIKLKKNYNERKKEYVKRTFYLNDYAKEMRVNSKLSSVLLTSFGKTNYELIDIEKKYAKNRIVLAFLQYFFCEFFLQNFVYFIYLLYKALILNVMSLSKVIVLFKSSTEVKGSIDELAKIYPYACETSMYINKLKNFVNTEVKLKNEGNLIPSKDAQTLELKHVYYSYNDKDFVLKDINMKIDLPSKIAIVGTNGAGKTTLVRLIMRMSDVSSGEILLDGVNIKEYKLEEYHKFIGVVFQDFKLYAASLLVNVILDTATKSAEKKVLDALKKCEFEERLKKLEHGLDTEITTEFYENGTNLSGGEAQKVAIARVVYGDCPMIILDEPSSALDPIAEYKLNKIMMDFGYRKQIFFISHRLSTTRDADLIYVLKDGQLIEYGTHKDLLDHAGLYKFMWNAQSRHY
jgi:ATP-binding cassette subfamily B protein